MKINKKAVFVGCARNCGNFVGRVLSNIATMANVFNEAAFVFIENDSSDQTRKILEDWGQGRPNFVLVNMDGLGFCPIRTIRLAVARNNYLEIIRHSPLAEFDYLFILDMDDMNQRPLDEDAIAKSIAFLEGDERNAACFANQQGVYYDMWALRHPQKCPNDVWEEVLDYVVAKGCPDQVAYDNTFKQRLFSIPVDADPIEVQSAFGGLGIYKLRYALRGRYVGYKAKTIVEAGASHNFSWQVCEHVPFHRGITSTGGRLYILPWLVNAETRNTSFAASFFRSVLFRT